MNLMKATYRIIVGALFLLLALTACTGNDVPVPEPLPEKEDMRIRWDVQQSSMESGRALVEDNTDLQAACGSYCKSF